MDRVTKMAAERPVVIFSKSSCCMSYTIKTLLCDFGVNPMVHELDKIPRGREIEQALVGLGRSPTVPAVFIGGELVGGANEVMSLHLSRSLKPMLTRAGALWGDRGRALLLVPDEYDLFSEVVMLHRFRDYEEDT